MSIIILISATDHLALGGIYTYLPLLSVLGHVALTGIHNHLPLPSILYFLHPWQEPHVLALFLQEWPIPSFLKGLCSFHPVWIRLL